MLAARPCRTLAVVAFFVGSSVVAARGEIVMKTEAYEPTAAGFAAATQRIEDMQGRNLLARRRVRLHLDSSLSAGKVRELFDGRAGTYGGEGRVMIDGQPTVINLYLGGPQVVTEIGIFTGNIDTRANQDFEVRVANNHPSPGVLPDFSAAPVLTSGDKVLGQNRGVFHTWFVDDAGGPLVADAVDWVQFRIWRTLGVVAGEPARGSAARGAASYLELEVLGTVDDVVLPSPRELQRREAVRRAPSAPGLVLRPTWQETLIATREAIFAWETLQDQLACDDLGLEFGPWHVLGPLPAKSQTAQSIRQAKRIDFQQDWPGADGQPLRWQRCEDLEDGRLHDLAAAAGMDKQAVVFLCRGVDYETAVEPKQLAAVISADHAVANLLPQRQRVSVCSPAGLVRGGWDLAAASGNRQLLVELKPDPAGRCRYGFVVTTSLPRAGGGDANRRRARQRALWAPLREAFPAAVDQAQIAWEDEDDIWVRSRARDHETWLPGGSEMFVLPAYRAALRRREEALHRTTTEAADAALASSPPAVPPPALAELRAAYYHTAAMQEAAVMAAQLVSLRLSVDDQAAMFGDDYPHAADYRRRIDRLVQQSEACRQALLAEGTATAMTQLLELRREVEEQAREMLLTNPLLRFDQLLLAEGGARFASNWGGPNSIGNRLVTLSPVGPQGQLTTIHQGPISSFDLHWDGQRILFSDNNAVWEIHTDGTQLRRITPDDGLLRYDPCYLPDGNLLFVSNACQQAVPCTGGANVGNLHLVHNDGSGERRLTFDQDHDWNPTVMHDGRVLYTRWEYTDSPHYFSRLLFRMNPDGTGQMEYYGSNSYWPNAMYWPRPIPGHPTMISCVVSGHHGVSRSGELLILDPARGRHEAQGAVQKIPGYGKPVEPVMMDQLVLDVWPKFAAPYPLAEPGTNRGAGKYFLACVQRTAASDWELCLVDIFDNITRIADGKFMAPIPLRPRPQPPALPSRVDLERKDALVYMTDVYRGPGLQGLPRGTIKSLRVGAHHYRYFGNGDTRASSMEGGWDVKRILGTVPVNEDGSALFRIPANTPVFVQPLDAEGKSQQVMRSWFTGMPGEVVSCVGCHERQNEAPPSVYSLAAFDRHPDSIEPWYGPPRGFSFDREIQPILDRRCVGCHPGDSADVNGVQVATLDLRAKRLHPAPEPIDPKAPKTRASESDYSPAYVALQRYVRRPGFESDYHMPKPAEYEADTSPLVQRLKKGHYNVQLSAEEWERLYAWIDFNVPYPANWRESHRPPTNEQVELRARYKLQFAGIEDRDEDPLPLPPIGRFEPPAAAASRPAPLELPGWPLAATDAADLQQQSGLAPLEIDLGEDVSMRFVPVPAGQFVMGSARGEDNEFPQVAVSIERPFLLGQFEVTNAQFARFDPEHNSGVIDERWKDRSRRGTAIDQPDAPVVRITWHQAQAFCEWLSRRSGRRCTLPSEGQWEWACRAGTATDFYVGDRQAELSPFANLADESLRGWNHGRAETGYNDGLAYSVSGGRFAPNAWGLYDMHGNVAEWCASSYRPYPYSATDGRETPAVDEAKVVRGGSWNETFRDATSAARWRYPPYQPVHNVGFRVAVEVEPAASVAAAAANP